MAQNDFLKRYIDAVLDFGALTQSRAEALVKDLVNAGEVQADQTREAVADLLEGIRKNREKLIETIRKEVRAQITNLGLASQADLDRIERRVSSMFGTATAPAKRAAKKATAKRTTAKKATAKKATARKATARKATAKKATAKKTTAKKSPAKKSAKKA